MKSVSELTDFYYKTLYPKLQKLEVEREKIRFRLILAIVFIAFIALFIFIALMRQNIISFDFFVIFGIFSFAIITFLIKYLSKDYKKRFKDEIFQPLIHAIDPNLKYLEENHLSQSKFEASSLFSTPDRLSGNDHISGIIDGITIEFSDILAEKKQKNSKGKDNWSTLFQGLYIITDFPKNFHGKTLVLPDKAQKTFGNLIGGWLQSNNFSKEQLVKMDDIIFEKEFVVYATDQIEARYILSHTLMQKIVTLKQRAKHDVYLSFKNNHLYIAIAYGKDLFEPTLFSSLLDYKVAMEYIQVLHMTVGLVEELKLNQKLWSKH
ncbi:MAG: DUF3137 domain-containing protein [Sulfurimonadaceae bacterium]|jgi:hypothetical protein|nr:DUF3137 domain-containing protein [Sulfurimonadaceae bacterium]